MATKLSDLKTAINDTRVDATAGTVDIDSEGFRAVNFILDDMQTRHDWEGTEEETNLKYYPGQTRYALPSDFKAPISLAPLEDFTMDFTRKSPSVFRRLLITGDSNPNLAVEQGNQPRMLINYPQSRALTLTLDSNAAYDTNGTYAVGADAINVRTDNVHYTENGGSIAFNVVVATSASDFAEVSKTLTTAVDITNYRNGKVFMKAEIPSTVSTIGNISSFTIQVGNSASVYFESTVTAQSDGNSFANGINHLGFDLESATETGTVDVTAIDFILFKVTYAAGMTDANNFRFGQMEIANYENMQLDYYSLNMVNDNSASADVARFDGTDDDDTLLSPEYVRATIALGAAWRLLEQAEELEKAESQHKLYVDRTVRLMEQFPSRRMRTEAPRLFV